jgi:hypothetical protein
MVIINEVMILSIRNLMPNDISSALDDKVIVNAEKNSRDSLLNYQRLLSSALVFASQFFLLRHDCQTVSVDL